MSRERTQGLVFSALVALALPISLLFDTSSQQAELIAIALLIAVFGVPHGALDPLFAKSLLQLKSLLAWTIFVVAYLFLAALVVMFWWLSPFVFLLFFLAFSVFHFSGDLAHGTTALLRLLYGGACIVLPAALHAAELGDLFSLLVGSENGIYLADCLHLMAWPWLAALGLLTLRTLDHDGLGALEIFAVAALTLLASPLMGFTLFFCAMHSARHILRSQTYAQASFSTILKVSALPMCALILMVSLGWFLVPESSLNERIVQFLFVGLAALTVPHMALVERIRFLGWRQG
jgi:Brp/Blh family beta-carotene 15,15'-monooxygenase